MINLYETIKQTISSRLNPFYDPKLNECHEESSKTAAVACCTESKALHPGRRRLKENYTSHWDLDYLPRDEVQRLLEEAKLKPDSGTL